MYQAIKGRLMGDLPGFSQDPLSWVDANVIGREQPVAARFGHKRMLFVAQPAPVKRVMLERTDIYDKGAYQDRLKPLLGEGMITARGARWSKARKTCRPSLSGSGLDDGLRLAVGVLLREVARLAQHEGLAFDLAPMTGRLVIRMATAAMFHEPLEKHEAETVYRSVSAGHKWLSDAMWRPVDLGVSLPTPSNRRFKQAVAELDAVVDRMALQPKGLLAGLGPLVDEFGPRALRDEAVTMLIAGFETTAMAAAWTLYALASRPDLVEWLRGEVDPVLGEGGDIEPRHLRSLERCQAFVDEVLRLYPSGWWTTREAMADDEIDGTPVPKGTQIVVCPWALHRQPNLWRDPLTFDPTRFLNKGEVDKFAFIPFGAGARACIGAHLAKAEMTAMVATMVAAFDMQPASGDINKIRPVGGVTLAPPAEGLYLRCCTRAPFQRKVA